VPDPWPMSVTSLSRPVSEELFASAVGDSAVFASDESACTFGQYEPSNTTSHFEDTINSKLFLVS